MNRILFLSVWNSFSVLAKKDQGQHPRFGLRGTFLKHTSEEVMAGLKKVEYSSRFAVAYFFDKSKAGSITNNQIAELSNCLR